KNSLIKGEKNMSKTVTVILAVIICMMPMQLAADQFDGSVSLLCAVIKVVWCSDSGDCYPTKAEVANIPRFLKINFKKKIITATEEDGRKDVIQIKNIEHANGKMILLCSESSRGWTMVISKETGKMTATVSTTMPDNQLGIIVLGASTKL
ncbi:MAG: hypothetical protein PVH67_11720, partial [Desulfobacterales bacterium]